MSKYGPLKRGAVRSDGRVFHYYHLTDGRAYEQWFTREQFAEKSVYYRNHSRGFRSRSPEKYLLSAAKQRAKLKGLPFNLEERDIIIPTHCPILGIELSRSGAGERTDISPSLDRLRPELGYVKGNISVISWRANWLKRHATSKELRAIADWMERN